MWYAAAVEGKMLRLIVIAAVMLASPCGAQTEGSLLRGLTKVDVLIEQISQDAIKGCGLTGGGVSNAVMFPLSSTSIVITNDDPTKLYININTQHFPPPLRLCVSSLRVQVYTYQIVTLEFSKIERLA